MKTEEYGHSEIRTSAPGKGVFSQVYSLRRKVIVKLCVFKVKFSTNKNIVYCLFLAFLAFAVTSCSHVQDGSGDNGFEDGYLRMDDVFTRAPKGTHEGDKPEDYWIYRFRVLAFERTSGQLVESNELYHFLSTGEAFVKHKIALGTYDFVFIANEPSVQETRTQLDNIAKYSDLNSIAFPARFFEDDNPLLMMQEVKNVEIKAGGSVVVDGIPASTLELDLVRMGVRVDVTLKAEDVLDSDFTGVTFSALPDVVPLMPAAYAGTIARSGTYTVPASEFSDNKYSATSPSPEGITWERTAARILLPSSEFNDSANKDKSVILTADMTDDMYSPSANLEIESDNYTLPWNTKLDFIAKVKMPLDVNIKVSKWDEETIDWGITPRKLNVTHSEINITDYNGVRIGFTSNMPVVKVRSVYKTSENGMDLDEPELMTTNYVFNSLVKDDSGFEPERFYYNASSGSGYMDIIVDQLNETVAAYDSRLKMSYSGKYTFKLTLSAEETDGSNALQKEIIVNVVQNGFRFAFTTINETPWGYCGAFFKNDETGERVITGNYPGHEGWTAEVTRGVDFITISSTPSFDPAIGTDSPGDPDLYQVAPNTQKKSEDKETGRFVKGRGRIYFRIGTKGPNPTNKPRYGIVQLHIYEQGDGRWRYHNIYVRQGEAADYVFEPGDLVTASGWSNSQRASAAKFSPYNLTHMAFKSNSKPQPEDNGGAYGDLFPQVNVITDVGGKTYGTNSDFVEYPSQAGALFSWGIDVTATGPLPMYRRRALYPVNYSGDTDVTWSLWNSIPDLASVPLADGQHGNAALKTTSFWNSTTDPYKPHFEMCPQGYHRPSDGSITGTADNLSIAEVINSEWRMSLFKNPPLGDGNGTTEPSYTPVRLDNTTFGAYADGFFDRRPIQHQYLDGVGALNDYHGVALNSADAAHIGTLFHNPTTFASVFFPSAGRRQPTLKEISQLGNYLEYKSSGYYLTSSLAPVTVVTPRGNAWSMEINFNKTTPISVLHTYAYSLRCVAD